MLHKEFYDATNADLFLVAEGLEPSGELVGALNVPRHTPDYAIDSIMRPELYLERWLTRRKSGTLAVDER